MQDDLLKLIGFEKPEGEEEVTIDQVREHINSQFVPINEIADRKDILEPIMAKAVGQRLGSLQTSLISHAKSSGLEVTHKDFEGKKIEDIVPELFGSFKEKLSAIKKPDSKLQEELDRYQTEIGEYKTTIETLQGEKDTLVNDFKEKEQGWLINHAQNQAWESVKFSPEVDELKKVGFRTKFNSQYELKTDDKGTVIPVYKDGDKKGSRVQNPTKLSEHLNLSELLTHEAQSLGLIAKPNEGKNGGGSRDDGKRTTVVEQPNSKVKLHPRFSGNATA